MSVPGLSRARAVGHLLEHSSQEVVVCVRLPSGQPVW